MEKARNYLRQGLETLQLELDSQQCEVLLSYLELLQKWGRSFNLTAIKGERDMVQRHVLDSLSILPHLQGSRFIDVGTGAGLPGIPLAIALPDVQIDLLDSNGKKTRFLTQAKNLLQLGNVQVHLHRAEAFQGELGYDGILSRAFSNLEEMVQCTRHMCAPGGCYYAMKGQHPAEEIAQLEPGIEVIAVRKLSVPGLQEDRHLVICRARETPGPDGDQRIV